MGVKSLWSLLTPVGRPVLLETMEGKTMAIDSSIWIYQFQATMRDKEGRGLVNAHVLGFLRRICKLLFYGIKPVFVFDGGAPVLKRQTIGERKRKKHGAAETHTKIAEKLLAAQMRRDAVVHAQKNQSNSNDNKTAPSGPVTIDEDTVYLEDLNDPNFVTPSKKKGKNSQEPSSKKKNRWEDYDPYRLPDIDMNAAIARVTRTSAPDPRLATEDELRAFIEEMRPEDLDVASPAFRELPTEVQYEIIGDLRLKSRQTSYKRLQTMLQKAKTSLDFSKAQIDNLKQRNALTQKLLETTDTIGQAHIAIPIRIASERNREYVLIRNEGKDGGWVLGIRDEGTESKPIKVDDEDEDNDDQGTADSDDDDLEEVIIPAHATPDPHLQAYRREMSLKGLARRNSSIKSRTFNREKPGTTPKTPKRKPLFELPQEDDDESVTIRRDRELLLAGEGEESDDDVQMSMALHASLEEQESEEMSRAIEASKNDLDRHRKTSASMQSSFDDERYLAGPSRLTTALSIANIGSSSNIRSQNRESVSSSRWSGTIFSNPVLLNPSSHTTYTPSKQTTESTNEDSGLFSADGTGPTIATSMLPTKSVDLSAELVSLSAVPPTRPAHESDNASLIESTDSRVAEPELPEVVHDIQGVESEDDMEEVHITSSAQHATHVSESPPSKHEARMQPTSVDFSEDSTLLSTPADSHEPILTTFHDDPSVGAEQTPEPQRIPSLLAEELSDGHSSRSPSPEAEGSVHTAAAAQTEDWDAAQEIDPVQEEGEFARFVSQVKGKDLESVRKEIDEEIRTLHQQRKAAMRDSEDVTQQMISQIMTMLRLFGIPYITAPMEAEAQCAELVSLGLVDGIITDDSDVFLFGGLRVFKNMFNQAKTVECFLLSDLDRELGLNRSRLICLAYLLGSDYVEGLPGVGPVVAMELLSEFPGDDGLHKFREWWLKVQTGRDKDEESASKFRRRFKKRFKELYLPQDWPNSAVRDAYYHPTVDSSKEPFKWGLPDLDALRNLFQNELGWSVTKVDELLLPIIQRMGKRGQANALNKQGNLNEYFDISLGTGTFEPRKRQAYTSRRLQELVTEHRKKRRLQGEALDAGGEPAENSDSEPNFSTPVKKRRATRQAKVRQNTRDDDDETEEYREPMTRKRGNRSRGGRAKDRGR